MSLNLDNLSDDEKNNFYLVGQCELKSNFLNAFANLLKYSSFEEVISTNNELINVNEIVNDGVKEDAEESTEPVAYTFRCGRKIVRIVDSNVDDFDNKFNCNVYQCITQIEKIHAILIMIEEFDDENLYSTLYQFHKSALNNLIFCFANNNKSHSFNKTNEEFTHNQRFTNRQLWNFMKLILHEVDLETSCQFKLELENNTLISLIQNKNSFFIDIETINELFTPTTAHFYDQQNSYNESWKQMSNTIQTMLNNATMHKPYECEYSVLIWQVNFVAGTYLDIIEFFKDDSNLANKEKVIKLLPTLTYNTDKINQLLKSLEDNENELKEIENICAQLYSLTHEMSLMSSYYYKQLTEINEINKISDKYEKLNYNFFTKIKNVYESNKLNNDLDLIDVKKLFEKLKNLKYSGEYFTEVIGDLNFREFGINLINFDFTKQNFETMWPENGKSQFDNEKLNQIQNLLSKLIEHNLLQVEMKNSARYDFSNATLENVIFTCDNSSNIMRDFIVSKQIENGMKDFDVKHFLDNIDQMIKTNIQHLIPVMKDCSPVQQIIENEIEKQIQMPSTSKQQNFAVPSPNLCFPPTYKKLNSDCKIVLDSEKLFTFEKILLKLIENDLFQIRLNNPDDQNHDFCTATLENVHFSCSSEFDFIRMINSDKNLNISQSDHKQYFENLDQLIKSNFEKLIPILQNCFQLRFLIKNGNYKIIKSNSVKFTIKKINTSSSTKPDILSKLNLETINDKTESQSKEQRNMIIDEMIEKLKKMKQ